MSHFQTNIKIFHHTGQNTFCCTVVVDPGSHWCCISYDSRIEGKKEYMRLNSVTASENVKYAKMPLLSGRFQHVCKAQMYDHTHKPKCKHLHPTLLSALSEVAGVYCQGFFCEGQSVSVIMCLVSHGNGLKLIKHLFVSRVVFRSLCHRIVTEKLDLGFMVVLSKSQKSDTLKAKTA